MKLTIDQIKELRPFQLKDDTLNSSGNIYYFDSKLVKIFGDNDFFLDEVERNIDFQMSYSIPNVPKIYDKIDVNGEFNGYCMQNINNSVTFRKSLGSNISFSNKVNAIMNIYQTIKFLHHHNIFLGDIHLDNFLIDCYGRGYVIDLDYLVFPVDKFKFKQLYCVKRNHQTPKINLVSKYTDNVKAVLCSLSLLYDIDLEQYISKSSFDIDLEDVYNTFIKGLGISELDEYFDRLINNSDVEYFDEFLLNNYLKNDKKKVI